MMTETTVLTAKDFTMLEDMRDRRLGNDGPLAAVLDRKLESAVVFFWEDVPASVATLNSRITFSVDGREPDTRVLCHDRTTLPVGLFLPITTVRGMALLGLAEGQRFVLTDHQGCDEAITLHKVEYQPEASRREIDAMARLAAPARRKPSLQLIKGKLHGQPRREPIGSGGFDDPGPSAA